MTVTLDRPDKLNALNIPLLQDLLAALESVDAGVRCVLFDAAGTSFCAGGDVGTFLAVEDPSAYLSELAGIANAVVRAIDSSPVPVVAAVQGTAGGAGIGLAAACDVVVCGSSSRFRPAYLSLGLSPDVGVSWLLARALGHARALDALHHRGGGARRTHRAHLSRADSPIVDVVAAASLLLG
jgi:2-(1,2-epoxy-1,2-dihydrophenyl)acetyl-CoA isomerase